MKEVITHAELVKAISADSQETEATVKRILTSLASISKNELVKGVEVTLHGLGKLKPVERAARKGRNPKTGEEIAIAASRTVKFSSTKDLKEALN